jgi:hypothetical protein
LGSNLTEGMNSCPLFFSVYVVLAKGLIAMNGNSPVGQARQCRRFLTKTELEET